MKITALILLAIMLGLGSCKKETGIAYGQLTGKNWKVSALTVSPAIDYDNDGDTETDLFQFKSCATDNVFAFTENGVFIQNEGAVMCSSNSQQTIVTSWAWAKDYEHLIIQYNPASTDTLRVISLSSSELIISSEKNWKGAIVTMVETLTAQ